MSSGSEIGSKIKELEALVDAAHKRIDHLEEELEDARSGAQSDQFAGSSGFDGRDQAVLEQLQPGQRVSASELKQLYRSHTDVRSNQTLKNRIKTLTSAGAFESTGPGAWKFVGGDET